MMIIPSFPFCTAILLLLSRNVLALPQPGEFDPPFTLFSSKIEFRCYAQKKKKKKKGAGHSAAGRTSGDPVNTDIDYLESYRDASVALGWATDAHARLADFHETRHKQPHIPKKSLRLHHPKAAENHRKIAKELGSLKEQVDRKIKGLEYDKTRGITQYHPEEPFRTIHVIAREALANAGKSNVGMMAMEAKGRGGRGAYTALSHEALDNSKAFKVDPKALQHGRQAGRRPIFFQNKIF